MSRNLEITVRLHCQVVSFLPASHLTSFKLLNEMIEALSIAGGYLELEHDAVQPLAVLNSL